MDDSRQMTTKKALLVVGVVVFLIATTFVVPAKYVGLTKSNRQPIILRNQDELRALSGDKDNNNIADWRDIALAGIGTTTQAEVKKVPVDPVIKKRLDDPNNLTASFSKNLYMASAYTQSKGEQLSPQQQEDLVSSMMQKEKTKIVTKTYVIADLRVNKEETDATKKVYGNALGNLLKKAENYKLAADDLKIMQAYSTSKNASLLEAFVVKRNNIDTLITSMLSLSVPYSAVPYHILALNRVSAYKTTIDNLSKAESDPIRSAVAVDSYYDVTQSMLNALSAMREYFMLSKITFTSNEPGYLFTSGYTKQ